MNLILRKFLLKLRGEKHIDEYIANGMIVGKNFWHGDKCSFDISHCWLIEIGDDVTFSSNVKLLAHDACTKMLNGYAKIGLINVGNGVFIGANSTILPNVNIGEHSIIAAGSVVTKNIPSAEVWGGIPAKKM